ncbi:fatty acyl-CoA reductase [Favolaschia claudopus]|uniref:Fatty acyl-CoA reductase n=1 Tax=Favolaschia claudopus TaxID=2862362 RepID=A0AAV9Z0L9_9AGAR
MNATPDSDPSTFFRKQTTFLTGGTGCLGGCLLYKLVMKLDVKKIYVLARKSSQHAIAQLRETMPEHIEDMLATNKILFVVGDVTTQGDLGTDTSILAEMTSTVNIVIHTAASLDLKSSFSESLHNNCLPALQLAQIAARFKLLTRFVFISTAYANSFLPGGLVEETIYSVGNAEDHLQQIVETGTVPQNLEGFPFPYAFVKNITEQLLFSRHSNLPILIVRPTGIMPAMREPYRHYSRRGSCPGSTYIEAYMTAPDSGVFRVPPLHPAGTNVLDEIPVDIVANIVLLHLMHGTTGIVHAGAESFGLPRTLADFHRDIVEHFPRELHARPPRFQYITDKSEKQGRYAEFWKVAEGDWHFSNAKSKQLAEMAGPLWIEMSEHKAGQLSKERARRISEEVVARMVSTAPRAAL